MKKQTREDVTVIFVSKRKTIIRGEEDENEI